MHKDKHSFRRGKHMISVGDVVPPKPPIPRWSNQTVPRGRLVVRVRRPFLQQVVLGGVAASTVGLSVWMWFVAAGSDVAVNTVLLDLIVLPIVVHSMFSRIDVTLTALVARGGLFGSTTTIALDDIDRIVPALFTRMPQGFYVYSRSGAWTSLPSVRATSFTGVRGTAAFLQNSVVVTRASAGVRQA